MVDYIEIRNLVKDVVDSRVGMPALAVTDIAGFICEQIAIGTVSVDQARSYLQAVRVNDFGEWKVDGKFHTISEHVSSDIINNPLYLPMEKRLVAYTAGSGQVGPGEFILAWYDPETEFQVDNNMLGDIRKRDIINECKKIGSNYTRAELFDLYASKGVHVLTGIYTVDPNSKNPIYLTQYCSVPTLEWRTVFTHELNNNKTDDDKDAYKLVCLAEKV